LVTALSAVVVAGALVLPAAASAATVAHNPKGSASFSRSSNALTCKGRAYDPDAPGRALKIQYIVDGKVKQTVRAPAYPGHFTRTWPRSWFSPGSHTLKIKALNIGAGQNKIIATYKVPAQAPSLTLKPYVAVTTGKAASGVTVLKSIGGWPRPTLSASGLPAGLRLNPTTGAITGTTTAKPGETAVRVTARNAVGPSRSATIEVVVGRASRLPVTSPPTQGVYQTPANCAKLTRLSCAVEIINIQLRIEGYTTTVKLPAGYSGMSQRDQLIAAVNAIRVAYGLKPLVKSTAAMNNAQAGAVAGRDPDLVGVPGGMASVWGIGFPTSIDVVLAWLYRDGPGSINLACTASRTDGCFGHRYALLDGYGVRTVHVGAGYDPRGGYTMEVTWS